MHLRLLAAADEFVLWGGVGLVGYGVHSHVRV